jgi:signal transduction histidine kinase
LVGLGYVGAVICASNLLNPEGASSWVFSIGACLASWGIGRVIRSRRFVSAQLELTTQRIAAQRGAHELLAIAEQRTTIARELQSLVGESVSSMIVQAQAAQRLLDDDPRLADAAMATVEDAGRQALEEMRRILGVLRHGEDNAELAPQPGIGQISALVEQIRGQQRDVALRVEGEPGPLPTSVDLGTYRILEEALAAAGASESLTIALRFDVHEIELAVSLSGRAPLDWPTFTMRERAALCEGSVEVEAAPDGGECLTLRLPRTFDEVRA